MSDVTSGDEREEQNRRMRAQLEAAQERQRAFGAVSIEVCARISEAQIAIDRALIAMLPIMPPEVQSEVFNERRLGMPRTVVHAMACDLVGASRILGTMSDNARSGYRNLVVGG